MSFHHHKGFDTERLYSEPSLKSVSTDKENHPLRSKILQRLQAQVQPAKGPLIRSGSAIKATNTSLNLSRTFLNNMNSSKPYIQAEEHETQHNLSSRPTWGPQGFESTRRTPDLDMYSTRLSSRTQRIYDSSSNRVKTENDEGRETLIKGLNWLKDTLQKSGEKNMPNIFEEIQFESRRPTVNQFGIDKSYFYSKNTCSESTQDEGSDSMQREEGGFHKRMTVQGMRNSRSTEKQQSVDKLRKEAEKTQREKMLFNTKKKQEEDKLKHREDELNEKKAKLAKYEEDLVLRENEVNESKRIIAKREKDFEELTKTLEEQSEDLMQQRMSYVQEIQVFNCFTAKSSSYER